MDHSRTGFSLSGGESTSFNSFDDLERRSARRTASTSSPSIKKVISHGSVGKPVSSPQVGVRWQLGVKQSSYGSKRSKEGFLGRWMSRRSRYSTCLVVATCLAILNAICAILLLDSIFGWSQPPGIAGTLLLGIYNDYSMRKENLSLSPPPSLESNHSVLSKDPTDQKTNAMLSSLHDPDLDTASEWTPSDSSFLRQQASNWIVNPFSTEPGAYILQQRDDYGCLLLLQDVCYVHTAGKSDLHNANTGIWFAQDLPRSDGLISKKGSVFTRDLSKIDFGKDVCNVYRPDENTLRPVVESNDLTYMGPRLGNNYGRFVDRRNLAAYIDQSTDNDRDNYFDSPVELVDVGFITRHDSKDGHFCEDLPGLIETLKHVKVVELPPDLGHGDKVYSLFYPSDSAVQSNWTSEMAKLLLGSSSSVTVGKSEGKPACFRNVAFVLNSAFVNSSVELFRLRAYEAVADLNGKDNPAMPELDLQDSEKLRMKDSAFRAPKRSSLRVWGGRRDNGLQITVVLQPRLLDNVNDIVKLLEKLFRGLAVKAVDFENISMTEQIKVMQKTVFLVGMHSQALNNVVFMRRGTILGIIFPFKFFSDDYRRLASRVGVHYFHWVNSHMSNSRYADNCMEDQGFAKLENKDCWADPECLMCARDKSITSVVIPEIEEVFVKVKPILSRFVRDNVNVGL